MYKYFISYATEKGFGWKILALPSKMDSEHNIAEVQQTVDKIVGIYTSIISFQCLGVM